MRIASISFLVVFILACGQNVGNDDIFLRCRQLVVVISPNVESTGATLYSFEKAEAGWQPVAGPQAVMLGRSGLAWGRGLHKKQEGPQKKEGDGKSPAGIFSLGPAFGYAPPGSTDFKLPYVQAMDVLECVDDASSTFYNQLTDSLTVKKDWRSSEFMHRPDSLYKWGIFVNHNVPGVAGNGSCIFFHIWKGPGATTSGCTAMPERFLFSLLNWLDPVRQPLLVQMTSADYRRFQKKYGLPAIP